MLLVNQTTETLQNLTVEFATLGDLKVVERPPTQNVGPHDFINLQSTIKVSSTDTGVIFGNVLYEGEKGIDSNVVILNDVHVDIMDYIKPAQCTETQFRTMWTEFEWENKVNINSKAKSLREFLKQLMACTNMSCLTPEASMKGDCQFLSANLYARSVFGELYHLFLPLPYMLIIHRRGRPCQLEHREGGRQWPDHWICPHSQSLARVSIELRVAEGVEQGWRCVKELLTRSCYDNAVRQREFRRKKLATSSIAHRMLVYVVEEITSLHKTATSANVHGVPDRFAALPGHACALPPILGYISTSDVGQTPWRHLRRHTDFFIPVSRLSAFAQLASALTCGGGGV